MSYALKIWIMIYCLQIYSESGTAGTIDFVSNWKAVDDMIAEMRRQAVRILIVQLPSGLLSLSWTDVDKKKKAIVASRCLNSVGKGENALGQPMCWATGHYQPLYQMELLQYDCKLTKDF
jgi:hypothetical protein